MSDISTQFTKEENKKNGRNGYYQAHREKVVIVHPYEYGAFISHRKRRKK